MATQSLMWTALPNGLEEGGSSVRLSVLLSPRLDPKNKPNKLSTFPDMVDWPKTLLQSTIKVRFGNKTVAIPAGQTTGKTRVDLSIAMPDSVVWKALFPGSTFVRPFAFEDRSNDLVLSYPTTEINNLVTSLYSKLAGSADDRLPQVKEYLADPGWSGVIGAVQSNDRRFFSEKNRLRDVSAQFDTFRENGLASHSPVEQSLSLLQLFHTPLSTPEIQKYSVPDSDPKAKARWLTHKQTALPKPNDFAKEIDFHQIVAAMNQYPVLLRGLGLVVDLRIDASELGATADTPLSVVVVLPTGSPSVTRTPEAAPRTRAILDKSRFQAVPRPNPITGDYQVQDGLLVLDEKRFELIQTDVDGAGLKLVNFARSLGHAAPQDARIDPTTRKEREAGAPSLRGAGLMLVHRERGRMLETTFDRAKKRNKAVDKIHGGLSAKPPDLYAEDLVRGFRVDAWDDTTGLWRSLCLREGRYEIDGGAVTIDTEGEEGTVRLAATTSPDPSSNTDIVQLHEALVSWTGWSLCARAPGLAVDKFDQVDDAEQEVPPGLRLETEFRAQRGSLPRLRFGRRYWLRARVVDLAGSSLPPDEGDLGNENPKKRATRYLRFEPAAPPSIALVRDSNGVVEKPAEGESMTRMAVRTFNDTPADNTVPATQESNRHGVPAQVDSRMAEQHSVLDAAGKVDAGTFAILASQDDPLPEVKLMTPGPLAQSPHVETTYAVLTEGAPLPYLPDPLAVQVAARIIDHPTFDPEKTIPIPLFSVGGKWPHAEPFRIHLFEDPSATPLFQAATRTLHIPLPKAARAILRLSIRPTKKMLDLFAVWNWLSASQKTALSERARNGRHWMITPWRDIELVHATQRPLITPELKLQIGRGFGETWASPHFSANVSIASTDRVDLLAEWNEPRDDEGDAIGRNLARADHAYSVKITDEKTYETKMTSPVTGGYPEHEIIGTDMIRSGGFFHDLVAEKVHEFQDTRYRRIEYWLDATTKFREYMPPNLLTTTDGGDVVPTDEHIKVIGKRARNWIPSSAPPPAPEVLYVVPTFGWTRSENDTKQSTVRRGGGLRVYLDRPWYASGYGEMLAVVLPSAQFNGDPNDAPSTQPLKNFVTQWGNDPIWASPFVSGATPKRQNFPLARTQRDPAGGWLPKFAPPEEADQPSGGFQVTGLSHPALETSSPFGLVEVAPHDVRYDPERQLWYCDIEVDAGSSYYPFVRLALARYQPASVSGAHLSNVVLADFMPLVPDRWLNVTEQTQTKRRVAVYGPTYSDSSGNVEAKYSPWSSTQLLDGSFIINKPADVSPKSIVEVWVERLDPDRGEDFGWTKEDGATVKKDGKSLGITQLIKPQWLTSTSQAGKKGRALIQDDLIDSTIITPDIGDIVVQSPALWSGTVTLPGAPSEDTRYRLVIAEYEEYLVDDVAPYDPVPTAKDRRLVFVEHVELT